MRTEYEELSIALHNLSLLRGRLRATLTDAIEAYMHDTLTGADLHAVLDDGNIEDDALHFCSAWIDNRRRARGGDGSDDLLVEGTLLIRALQEFTELERAQALRHGWNFVEGHECGGLGDCMMHEKHNRRSDV